MPDRSFLDWPFFEPGHREIRQKAAAFAGSALASVDHADVYGSCRRLVSALGDCGLLRHAVTAPYGGASDRLDVRTLCLIRETLAYEDGLADFAFAMQGLGTGPITLFGTEEQKRRWLPKLVDGSVIAAHGMSEPGSGSDAFSLSTTATKSGSAYVLDGSKTFVTNAPESELFVVFGTIDKELGFAGVTAFLVEKGTPGLTVGKPISKMGLRTSPMSELFFDGCEVSEENVLGKPGGGMLVFDASMTWERGCILASTVGTMQRQLERSLAHAQERRQFGQPIGSFQAVSHKLVDMRLRLDTSRLLLYRLGWLIDRGESTALESALVKLHLSESYVRSSLDALQVHGGYGYMTEYELERDVRDAIGSKLYSGTSELQYNVAAKSMGL